jgi:uncharacterized membrane protein HdeD (DUF308 family)
MNPLIDKAVFKSFGRYTFVVGGLLILLGTIGILVPNIMSLGTDVFVAWLLLIGGAVWATHTYQYSPTSVMDWLKPVVLVIIGGAMLFFPAGGVAGVGLLLAVYLLMDSFSSFVLAQSVYPGKGWGWMGINGVVSVLLAALFMIGWPETSYWLVGLYVAISLVFDGWALLFIGWALRKEEAAK